jgi:hypothetical protein
LFDTKDIDNNTIDTVTSYQLPFLSKEIAQQYENLVTTSVEADLQFVNKENRNGYIIFESENPSKDEISIIPKYPMGVFEGSDGNPLTIDTYFLKAVNPGTYNFHINHQFQFTCNIVRHVTTTTVGFTSWALKVWFVIKRADGSANTSIDLYSQTGTDGNNGDQQVLKSVSITQNITSVDLKANDKVFYYCHFGFTASTPLTNKVNTYVHVVNVNQSITVDALTTAKTTFGKSIFIGDAMKKAFQMVTGKSNPIVTKFYSLASEEHPIDGCGSKFVITNGFQIRNFDSDNRPIRTSLNEMMNSLSALHCIGMSYEFDGTEEIVKIEKAEEFYKDVEILKIDNYQDYEEITAKDLIFNQVEVGYEKYLDEGASGLEDIHTKHQYQTPIKSQANKKPILCKYIASGEVIEKTRREQFSEKPKDSTSFDDNIFIIATIPFETIEALVSFFREEYYNPDTETNYFINRIMFTNNYNFLVVGYQFVISGSVSNNKTFTISEITTSTDGFTHILVEEETANEVDATVNISLPDTTIQPESQERINVISGTDADTFYNLCITPKRMLLNHAKFVNSGLRYKNGSDFLKLTDIKGNGEIATQFKEDAICNLGDSDKSILIEKGDIFLANFDSNDKLFSPEFINFTTNLTRQQIRYINNALRGRNTDGTNYGYISIRKPRSEEYIKVYINSMKFNPLRGDVIFQTVKKKP